MTKRRPYYVLVVRDTKTARWGIHFGDFSKPVVAQERLDIIDSRDYAAGNTKIIVSIDNQLSIDAAVAALNPDAFKVIDASFGSSTVRGQFCTMISAAVFVRELVVSEPEHGRYQIWENDILRFDTAETNRSSSAAELDAASYLEKRSHGPA